jgi:hypothetical protein
MSFCTGLLHGKSSVSPQMSKSNHPHEMTQHTAEGSKQSGQEGIQFQHSRKSKARKTGYYMTYTEPKL